MALYCGDTERYGHLLDFVEESKRRYRKNAIMSAAAVLVGFAAAIIIIKISNQWLFASICAICPVKVVISFLRYRKTYLRFLEYFSGISGKKVV